MPRIITRRVNARRPSSLLTLLGLFALLACALTRVGGVSAQGGSPGTLSFSQAEYDVSEGVGVASVTLKRAGGTAGAVLAKVSLTDVTTSPADYVFKPGSLDTTFQTGTGANQEVNAVALQPDGKLIVGGFFSTYNGVTRRSVARLNPDGSLDTSFDAGMSLDGPVNTLTVQPDGKIIIAGGFNSYNGIPQRNIVRLNSDGSTDTSFDPGFGASGTVFVTTLQPDGKILIAGDFTYYNAVSRNHVARLNPDGSLDSTFNVGTGFNYGVASFAVQPDNEIIVGGGFTSYNGTTRIGIARLYSDGTLDTSYNSGGGLYFPNAFGIGSIDTISLQPDGRALITGLMTMFNGVVRNGVARLNTNGSLDPSFDPGTGVRTNGTAGYGLTGAALQPDGKLIICGSFDTYNETPRNGVARLNTDGSLDTTFNPVTGFSKGPATLALQPNGKVVIAGYLNGPPTAYVARLTGDYFVNWAAGDASDKTISLPIVEDTVAEPDETLALTLTPLSGGAAAGAIPTANLVIKDNDSSLSPVSGGGVYNGTATLTATLTGRGSGLGGRAVSFTLNGAAVCGVNGTPACPTTDAGGVATLANVSLSGVGAGTHANAVGAAFAGDADFAGSSGTGPLSVSKAAAGVTLGGLAQTFDGAAKSATATTAPPGLNVSFSYSQNGQAVPSPTNAGSYDVTATVNDSNYQGSATGTLVIGKASQTITFAPLPNKSYGDADFTVSATASSGLPVTINMNFGPCTVNGSTVHITGAGSCRITAVQFGDSNYNGAAAVPRDLTIAPAPTSVALSSSANPSGVGQSVTFTATVTSPAGTPPSDIFGGVFFYDGGVMIANCGTFLSSGQAACTTSALSPGGHTITAEYTTNNPNFTGSRGTLQGVQAVGGVFDFSQSKYTAAERGGSVTITVTRTGITSQAMTVDYSTDDGSISSVSVPCSATTGAALERCDYTRAAGTLSFAANETQKTFTVLLNDDSFAEGTETLTLRLLSPGGGAGLGAQSVSVLQINDDVTESSGNPLDDASFFVRQHYHDFLNREPDADGLAFWADQMRSCGSPNPEVCRVNVSAAFFLSIEFQQTGYFVERMYKVAYGDATGTSTLGGAHQLGVPVVRLNEFLPDTQRIGQNVAVGLGDWQQRLERNKQAYSLEFVQRGRFAATFPATMTAGEFVSKLDQNAGGVLTESEKSALAASLGAAPADPSQRAQVVRAVAENAALASAETNRAFVLMQFFGYLRRNPNDAPDADYTGYDFWLSKLNQFQGNFVNAEMVRAFINSDEYRKRFGQ
ncbi:MAG: Ig-like domain repeat protein [Acidobacteria bacterium]|nr:Ig-like domain repeat protein [Acidobacteriota bacterium]